MVIAAPYGALECVELRREDIDIQDKCKTTVSDKDVNKSGDSRGIKLNCG